MNPNFVYFETYPMCLPQTRVYGQLPPQMVPLMMVLAMEPFAKAGRAIGVITGTDHILVEAWRIKTGGYLDTSDRQERSYSEKEVQKRRAV